MSSATARIYCTASLVCFFQMQRKTVYNPGPAAANALSPKVLYVLVTTHVQLAVERICRSRASVTRQQSSAAKCQSATDKRASRPWSRRAGVLVPSVADGDGRQRSEPTATGSTKLQAWVGSERWRHHSGLCSHIYAEGGFDCQSAQDTAATVTLYLSNESCQSLREIKGTGKDCISCAKNSLRLPSSFFRWPNSVTLFWNTWSSPSLMLPCVELLWRALENSLD